MWEVDGRRLEAACHVSYRRSGTAGARAPWRRRPPATWRPLPRVVFGARGVYPARVSGKLPQTYILHTVALFIVIAVALVIALMHAWG